MRQRRRAERGHFAPPLTRDRAPATRRNTESRQRAMLLFGASAVVVALIAIIGYGWFTTSFQPPRKAVAEVAGEPVLLREVVPQTLMDLTITSAAQPQASLSTLVRGRLLRLGAPDLGFAVTAEDIDRDLVGLFEPITDPEAGPPTTLTEAGQDLLNGLLDRFELDRSQYVQWREELLLDEAAREHFTAQQPDTAEQVFVSWIAASSQRDIQTAMERVLAGEEFADVARDFSEQGLAIETRYADPNGEVGWVPRGAFTELDNSLFNPELEQGTPLGPFPSSFGSLVFTVTDGPSEEPLTEEMRSLTGVTAFQAWLDAQAAELLGEFSMTDDDTRWVLREICKLSTPPINCQLVG